MDTNGQVTDAAAAEKPAGMQSIFHCRASHPRAAQAQAPHTCQPGPANGLCSRLDKEVDEMTDMFKGLSKKKKSKKSSKETGDAEEPTADGEFDASALKKKKKKVKKDAGDFEAKLAEAGLDEEGDKEQAEEALPEGDAEAGTGIWAHDATQVIPYPLLVSRFFALVQSHHPDLLASGTKAYKIPPPQCLREGNRRTVFANIAEICARMKRSDEHVTQFLFAELGTSGSVDGSKRLVIKGRYVKPRISTHPSFRPSKGLLGA